MMSTEHSWVVGLDLDEYCHGALAFADWLGRAGDVAAGVHVLEAWTRPHVRGDAISAVRAMTVRVARALRLAPLARVTALEAVRAEDGLTLACAAEVAQGLVIGRAARTDRSPFVRLGVVARNLLRQLPKPVIVVPPDLPAVAPGPVLLATDLADATEPAVAFARALAARHGRALELVHVGERRHSDLIDALDPGWLAARDSYRAAVADLVRAWAGVHRLADAPRHVVYGEPAAQIAAVAAERQAALIVVGSRRLGLVTRAFLSSTASTLAAHAACPVAVVPLV